MTALNLYELEKLAKERLPEAVWDYYSSGASDEVTLRENRAAFERIPLFYRVLVDVSQRELSLELFGAPCSMPILLAPTAFHRLAHAEGELASVRAAGSAGVPMVLSTLSNTRIEDVTAASSGAVWFQLYVYRDRGATAGLVARAEAAGCRAIVVTVDAPLLGRRERDVRNRFQLPDGLSIENMLPEGLGDLPRGVTDSGLAAYFAALLDPSLNFRDIEWLCSITRLPVLVKGIVRADDAVRAVQHGASGIVVSNHGGRQLDTSPATVDALPAVVDAVADRAEVLLDGGIRRGTDVIKALALGARAVLVGRPVLWGLAVDGQKGVEHVLELLRAELDLGLALVGCPRISELSRDLVGR